MEAGLIFEFSDMLRVLIRILQKIIGKIDHNDLQIIINEIQNVIPELMLDSYGNYMVQSLVNVCTVDQRFVILEKVNYFNNHDKHGNKLLDCSKNFRDL